MSVLQPAEFSPRTIFCESEPGRRGVTLAEPGVPTRGAEKLLPTWARRGRPLAFAEVSEPQAVRHYTRLSQRNFSIDTHFYPLGSCTMKYNPRVNEQAAALPGFSHIHPYQDPSQVQGALKLMWDLEQMLGTLTGLDAVCLQPAAGAHGELTGLMCIRAYHEARGDNDRTHVLIPDSAHGTNPASVTLTGLHSRGVKTAADGGIDMADLDAKLGDDVAALMITNPSTLGLFERRIREVADRVHAAGGLVYMDGANLNALLGVVRPADLGTDVMHINLHKTLSTPHGGGGPGSGPIAVVAALAPYLPTPRTIKTATGEFTISCDFPHSVGRVKGFYGHAGMFWRAYAYLRSHSGEDLAAIAKHAVLNANYVLVLLRDHFDLAYDRGCMHEVVLSARKQKGQGASALDIAKRLLEYGFHPPTVYFPLIVAEALMLEPTETESKQTLDRFCEAMVAIAKEAAENPQGMKDAPRGLWVRRLDEVTAARKPVLRWHEPTPSA